MLLFHNIQSRDANIEYVCSLQILQYAIRFLIPIYSCLFIGVYFVIYILLLHLLSTWKERFC